MLFCNGFFLLGTWEMHDLQVTNVSPVVGISMIWVFGIGYIVSLGMGLCAVLRIWRITTGTLPDAELLERPPQAGSEAAL